MQSFFNGTFPGKAWHHREHIIMAAWHLLRYPEAECLERIRTEIKRYNVSQGGVNSDTSGYHETLTQFWLRLTADALAQQPKHWDELERLRLVADQYGSQARLYLDYYGFDVVGSTAARKNWIDPDLQPLPRSPGFPL